MQSMSMNITQQLVADRHSAYEGVAARRRLRKIARRSTLAASSAALVATPPTPHLVVRRTPMARVITRKVA